MDTEIKREFRNRKMRLKVINILLMPLVCVFAYLTFQPNTLLFGFTAQQIEKVLFMIIPILVLAMAWSWQCPNCKKRPGNVKNPYSCSNCGVPLR
ncbi:hypothetical protein [Carboxylicivirga sp. M1479]|uniref:hypothetical protein n=1 Tax=Carboxylicivirga sp. M1479 TaxID=2594476 RepID=UPI0011784682|nr:hypothetical protein [Carboxylicivirga sp. M1479]TRX65904.1 hypothetical protein FNN09_16055 [Carboxylicivirga sp. M1479]